jgi:hypothetical protein
MWNPKVQYCKEEFYLLAYNAMQSIESQPHFGGTCCLQLQGQSISQARNQDESRWQADLKTEVTYTSRTLVEFQWNI